MMLLDDILDSEIRFRKAGLRMVDLFFLAFMLGLGIAVRLPLFDFVSGDYYHFLSHWMEECHAAGGVGYLGITPAPKGASTINYGCMYQYVIVLLHYIPWNDLHLIKIVSVIFDVICAITVFRITFHVTEGNVQKSVMAFAAVILLPTVILNSAAWAQCDSIYTAFALLSVLHVLKGNNNRVFIYLALGYTFKQQVIFIVPFLIIMWLKGKVKARYIFWIPIVIILTMIPAMIAGRGFFELLSIYGKQVSTYSMLTMNYPSIFAVVNPDLNIETRKMIIASATVAAIAVLGFIAYYVRNKNFKVTPIFMITLAIFTSVTALYSLPVMHERYGYLPEVLAVVYAVTGFKRLSSLVMMQFISIVTYSKFLFGTAVNDMWLISLINLAVILFIGFDLYTQMKAQEVADA
ncbi:hypothetical protein [Butyrivibrio sp. XPD2006]|uniref:hypothetical protein n=1 Tax=Butyrivibrio sp. XPD2006 TaxID=1280668 RepID=UPI0003B4BB6C|nr:hypothetical protein [Butyrivibrio sp. XPD2006]